MTDPRSVAIPVGESTVQGDLVLPDPSTALVVFAHGSGSSRASPRNRFVAEQLHVAGFGTLLLDLLTEDEDHADQRSGEFRFDVDLLAARLVAATRWVDDEFGLGGVPFGYFGASTGAAAALVAAAILGDRVAAVVSRGGRVDLAGDVLQVIAAPVLLIVGERDEVILELNRKVAVQLSRHALEIVPGATHLFEEPGALERVAALAADWFGANLRPGSARTRRP